MHSNLSPFQNKKKKILSIKHIINENELNFSKLNIYSFGRVFIMFI